MTKEKEKLLKDGLSYCMHHDECNECVLDDHKFECLVVQHTLMTMVMEIYENQWSALTKMVTAMRDSNGSHTQAETCQMILDFMNAVDDDVSVFLDVEGE